MEPCVIQSMYHNGQFKDLWQSCAFVKRYYSCRHEKFNSETVKRKPGIYFLELSLKAQPCIKNDWNINKKVTDFSFNKVTFKALVLSGQWNDDI